MSVKKKAMDRAKKLDRAGLQRVLTTRLGDRQTVGVEDAVLRDRLGLGPEPGARQHARGIVVAAAKLVNGGTRRWFLDDERGTWERMAGDLLAKTPAEVARKVQAGEMTRDRAARLCLGEVTQQIATALAFHAVSAELARRIGGTG